MRCWLQGVQVGFELRLQGVEGVELGLQGVLEGIQLWLLGGGLHLWRAEVQEQVVVLQLRGWELRVQVVRLRGEWMMLQR